MQIQTTTKLISAALLSLLISACGGGDSSPLDGYDGGGSSSSAGIVDTTSPKKIGSGTGDNFTEGAMGVTNNITDISSGGTTTLTLYVVSSTNTPVTAPVSVSFISDCVAAKQAVLKNAAGTETSTVSTINGRATINYTANGCSGTDTITASAQLEDEGTKYAQVTLNIAAGTVGSIRFIEATPTQISLKGSGGRENAIVKFQILDGNGAPVQNTDINFSTNIATGGITLTPTSARSDAEGYVFTTINAGTVATVVSVTATIPGINISTTSDNLTISTGVPVQKNASLSLSQYNPRAADKDGTEIEVVLSLADDFNNPVADNTAVSFWAEGGSIAPSCTTLNGVCTVKWRSQDFRPDNMRVTIFAFAAGNETFTDINNNGRYDQGEPFVDLPEAFRDDNENNIYDIGEKFVDLIDKSLNPPSLNGIYDATGDGVYSGTLCYSDDAGICTKDKITIRRSWVISMSSPIGVFGLYSDSSCTVESNGNVSTPGDIYILVSDYYGNSLPNGTSVKTSNATGMTVSTLDTTVPNTPNPSCYPLSVSGTAGNTGRFTVSSETREGEISSQQFSITFN